MSSANKPHKVLAQAQKTIQKLGWVKGSWYVQGQGVCLEGAVGIRANDHKTRTPVRESACTYIARASEVILGFEPDRIDARNIPGINDSILQASDKDKVLEILELAEQMAYKDYISDLEKKAFADAEDEIEEEDDDEIVVDFATFLAQRNS